MNPKIRFLFLSIALVAGVVGLTASAVLLGTVTAVPTLAWVSVIDGNQDVFIADPRSKHVLNVSDYPGGDGNPEWSEDGRYLSFTTARDLPAAASSGRRRVGYDMQQGELFAEIPSTVTNRNTSLRNASTEDSSSYFALAITPNDDSITVSFLPITAVQWRNRRYDRTRTYPTWADDGRRFAFISDVSGTRDLYIGDVTGMAQNISKSPAIETFPQWSPDDNYITFVSNDDGNAEIMLYSVRRNTLTNLSHTRLNDLDAVWQPITK